VLKQLFFWIALFWTLAIAFFCLIKASNIPDVTMSIPNLDKIVHAFFHFSFTILWFLFFQKHYKEANSNKLLIITVLLSICFGITIEILQELFTTTRKADVFDVLANFSGAMLASGLILYLKKQKSNLI
jgi:VanZ family protein